MRSSFLIFLALVLTLPVFGEDSALRFLEDRVKKDPDDFTAQNMLASRYLDLLRSTGEDQWLAKARHASEISVKAVPVEVNIAGLAALARVRLASHEFAAARDDGKRLVQLAPHKAAGFSILGDALLELGDYNEAAEAYQKLGQLDEGGIDSESRLARLALVRGDLDAAREHFNSALTQSRALLTPAPSLVAWCCVQLGQLYFSRGDLENAEKQYQAALEAMPDYYSAVDHMAELRASQEKYPEAIRLYEGVITRVPRPELCQALGDLYAFAGKMDQARPWHERALTAYLKSAEQGDGRYIHHLAGFYSDSEENSGDALKWARKDLEIRHSVFAHDAMAWALYKNGQMDAAAAEMKKALAEGTKDGHLYFHASMIFSAKGDLARGKEFLHHAAGVNPRYNAFHVHR